MTGGRWKSARAADRQLIEAIRAYHDAHHIPPTIRELATACGKSSSATYLRIQALEKAGVVLRQPKMMRSIRLAEGE